MFNDANNAKEEFLHVPFGRPLACEGLGGSSSQSWKLVGEDFCFWLKTMPFWCDMAPF